MFIVCFFKGRDALLFQLTLCLKKLCSGTRTYHVELTKAGVPRSLLGTRLHSGRCAAGQRARLHLPLPIAPRGSHYHLSHPRPPTRRWKNCLPGNRSLVPKRLGTAGKDKQWGRYKEIDISEYPCYKVAKYLVTLSPNIPLKANDILRGIEKKMLR